MPLHTPSAWDRFWLHHRGKPPRQGEGTWERLTWEISLDFWQEFFAREAPGRRLLECGCGSAQVAAHLAQHGYDCTLVDYSEVALDLARRRFTDIRARGKFVRTDVTAMCFPDAYFDIVFSGGLLEFFGDVRLPIGEMARVLKPGGVLAASMVPSKWSIQTLGNAEQTAIRCIWRLGSGRLREAFDVVRSVPLGYGVHLNSLTDYRAACTKAGLVDVVATGVTPFPALTLPRPFRRAYTRLMSRSHRAWQRFDRSHSRWTEWWGIAYRLHARKPR